jgi:hypothetical protein
VRLPKWLKDLFLWLARAKAAGLVDEKPGNLGAVMHERRELSARRRRGGRP